MHAAVVRSFTIRRATSEFPGPEGENVVEVLAAALHPRVRSTADGTHYESTVSCR